MTATIDSNDGVTQVRHLHPNFQAARLTVAVSGSGLDKGRLIERLRALLDPVDRDRVRFLEAGSPRRDLYFHVHGPDRPITVTFSGPMCSGKTTIIRELQQKLSRADLRKVCFAETVAPERPK